MATSSSPSSAVTHTAIHQIDLGTIEAGVPLDLIAEFSNTSGIPLKGIYEIVIPPRTLKHRRSRAQNLSLDESDKFARLIRVYNHAVEVFGDTDDARLWLTEPHNRFEKRSPLQMLRTEAGARLVDGLLWQIADGMFA